MTMHELECRDVHARIRSGHSLDDGAIDRHLQGCPACAVLFERAATLGGSLAAADETQEHISTEQIDAMLERLDRELAKRPPPIERVRQAPTRSRALGFYASAAGLLGLAGLLLAPVDLSIYPLPRLLASIAGLLAAVLAAGAVVLRPLHRKPLPGWLLGALAGFAVIVPGIVAALPAPDAWVNPDAGRDFVSHALVCFAIGMGFALLLVGAAWLVELSGLRRRGTTVLGLVGAGALANLVLVLHCSDATPAHKLLGHASISAVLLAVAGLVSWWLLGRSRR